MRPRIVIEQGDITRAEVDAIVNAANEGLLGGGGVDGAIHRAAGPELLAACRAVSEVAPGVRCPTGEARITPGFGLRARFVIHTVGPVYRGHPRDAQLLARAFRSSLDLAVERALETVALPAISCGIYGYPIAEAAAIGLGVAADPRPLREVRFVLFSAEIAEAWRAAAG